MACETRARERPRSVLVRLDASTVAALAMLTEALDQPDVDIAKTLERLADAATAAVPSLIGLSVQTARDETFIEVTGRVDGRDAPSTVGTSLMIPLPERSSAESGTRLILFAGQPGALVDLGADLAWLTGSPLDAFRLDEHLSLPAEGPSVTALQVLATVNQAVGVLIERGRTAEEATQHLDQLAALAGIDRAGAAARLLARLSDGIAPG
jgi:hypothetical protein